MRPCVFIGHIGHQMACKAFAQLAFSLMQWVAIEAIVNNQIDAQLLRVTGGNAPDEAETDLLVRTDLPSVSVVGGPDRVEVCSLAGRKMRTRPDRLGTGLASRSQPIRGRGVGLARVAGRSCSVGRPTGSRRLVAHIPLR
ncbi:hypothetical protein ASC87_07890 [Rhizobacter sp. Root1221]|nr:hypothetical protein ASC87_07890 [Rhizobacter sp. Root1221]